MQLNSSVSNMTPQRQSMLWSGLTQAVALIALHSWFKSYSFEPSCLVWAVPLYSMAVLGPVTFNFLRGEFTARRSLPVATLLVLAIAATAGWLGWSVVPAQGSSVMHGQWWVADVAVFGGVSLAAWFVALPFLQGRLRTGAQMPPYAELFADAWRNTLLAANCLMFTGLFWLLLLLCAGLFSVLKILFFQALFTNRFFFYWATTMAVSFAVSLEEHESSALITMRRHLLAFQTRLLPLAALIVLLFLAALPFTGLQPLWNTGHATPLMLCLQLAIVALTNAAWQDGERPTPFSKLLQWLIRAALVLLPVLAILCCWSLSLRVLQYGWSVDRFWGAVLVGLTSLYAASYSVTAIQAGWLPSLGRYNTWIALVLIVTLLAIHTPLLDPQGIAAASQVGRLLAGKADAEHFDYQYLRFNLGRAGNAALQEMVALVNHPKAEIIRNKAKAALEKKERDAANRETALGKEEIVAKLTSFPAGTSVDPAFLDYLENRFEKKAWDYDLASLRNNARVMLLAIDLDGDTTPEYILLANPYPLFTHAGGWRQAGNIIFAGNPLNESDIALILQNGDYTPMPRQMSDLKFGDRSGTLVKRQTNEP